MNNKIVNMDDNMWEIGIYKQEQKLINKLLLIE